MTAITLNKLDVATRQLNQAIRLFFDKGDSVSIHTLAEAAVQILRDTGGKSPLRDSDYIRPAKKGEWLRQLAHARNFFKHADRDSEASLLFYPDANHFSIVEGVMLLGQRTGRFTAETVLFQAWFLKRYPDLFMDEAGANPGWRRFMGARGVGDPDNLEQYRDLLNEMAKLMLPAGETGSQ